MFADAKDVETDRVRKLDLLEQIVHAVDRADREPRDRVCDGCRETIDAELHVWDS